MDKLNITSRSSIVSSDYWSYLTKIISETDILDNILQIYFHDVNNYVSLSRVRLLEIKQALLESLPKNNKIIKDIDEINDILLNVLRDQVYIPNESNVIDLLQIGEVNVNNLITSLVSKYFSNYGEIHLSLGKKNIKNIGNKYLLEQILKNLIDNAIYATRVSNNRIIKLKTYIRKGGTIIDIFDNGEPISEQIREDLFKKRVTTKKTGYGYGLLLAKNILNSWEGSISYIKNKEGKTFRIKLSNSQKKIDKPNFPNVLIVEDDIRWGKEFSKAVESRDYNAFLANDINSAIDLIKNTEFNIALIDISLNKGDLINQSGFELIKQLSEFDPKISIFAISGYPQNNRFIRNLFNLGVDEFIPKNEYSKDELIKIIRETSLKKEIRQEAYKQEQLDKLVYEVLSMISHEFRTPLTVIKRHLETLENGSCGPLNDEQLETTKIIKSYINREFQLIEAHIDVNRIDRGIENIRYSKYDLKKLLLEEIQVHINEFTDKAIKVEKNIPENKVIVDIDVERFRVAINPLIDNSIKFSPRNGKVKIELLVEKTYVEVRISDQGPGIKPDEINFLMSPGVSRETFRSPRIKASGLGISLSKRMIEMHGGQFWIESDGKNGTTVGFRIPYKNGGK